MMNKAIRDFRLTPVSIAVLVSVGFMIFMAVVGGSILLNYIITISYIHHQDAVNAVIAHKAQVAQVKSSAGICEAIRQMNDASKGATNASSSASSYGHKLSAAISNLYSKSGCAAVLKKYGSAVE